MTRLIRIELCDECPHAAGSRSCRASSGATRAASSAVESSLTTLSSRTGGPLEQVAPDWRPPATIDLYGPPRYTRGMTDGTSASNLDWRRSP